MTDPATVEVSGNGPYKVCGVALADDEGGVIDAPDPAYLCRCGGSANKPFCDGTHATNGFDGSETADPGPQAARRQAYVGAGVTIYDDRSVCSHAGRCTAGLPAVWRMGESPWIDPNGATAAEIIDVIRTCPSGALTYSIEPEGDIVEDSPAPVLVPGKDGPYELRGDIEVTSASGEAYEKRARVTLCRCGASKNKPFCDGAHWDCEFKAASRPDPA